MFIIVMTLLNGVVAVLRCTAAECELEVFATLILLPVLKELNLFLLSRVPLLNLYKATIRREPSWQKPAL